MSDVAIQIENLGKMYRIGGKQERYRTLRDSITDAVSAPFKRARSLLRGQAYGAAGLEETIWALHDVSFEVKHGEVVGIIGRNGAGKSTLLKILSRITEPTEGHVDVYGRVGALLEVGTGFHLELTGRENIYLNGAILGMSRAEINRRFDEIVDFAEVEKFIDTPVKHYSSGMGLRLGFAVAAHLEPEILVVDEVLAVGDTAFQRKCVGKMGQVAGEGRTVLFVSHNMAAVNNLCTRAVLLNSGQIDTIGAVDEVINDYIQSSTQGLENAVYDLERGEGNNSLRFSRIALLDRHNQPVYSIGMGDPLQILLSYSSGDDTLLRNVVFSIRVEDLLGQRLLTFSNEFTTGGFDNLPSTGTIKCFVPSMPLVPGNYRIFLWAGVAKSEADRIENAASFSVYETNVLGSDKVPSQRKHGAIFAHHTWESI
jgi:lipopolysaccharide transport system ATP-binding protein